MRLARLALVAALPFALAACSSAGPDSSDTPSAQASASPAPTGTPVATDEPSGSVVAPEPVESPNTDEQWDDWSTQRLPAVGEVDGVIQLIRLRFGDDSIDGHIRVALPEGMIQGEGVDYCPDGPLPAEMVGFGEHWSSQRTLVPGWIVCDTSASFTLDEWGAESIVPAPTRADGVWRVDLGEAFSPEPTIGLFRLRLEFDGAVTSASEGGNVDGTTVTWRAGGPASAEAKDS